MKYRKKKDKQSVAISKSTVTPNLTFIELYKSIFKEPIRLQPRCKKDKKFIIVKIRVFNSAQGSVL